MKSAPSATTSFIVISLHLFIEALPFGDSLNINPPNIVRISVITFPLLFRVETSVSIPVLVYSEKRCEKYLDTVRYAS